ncbi:MAG: hypothetical protein V1740_05410 [Candidatus Woesearchaeota archaeon]
MKKMLSILGSLILVLAIMPLALADEGTGTIGGGVTVGSDCSPPVIYVDPTARVWEPNDQTYYTAELYGALVPNEYGNPGYEVSERQNYVFTGETLKYVVAVYDEDGEDDIDEVRLKVNGAEVGQCLQLDEADLDALNLDGDGDSDDYLNAHFNIPYDPTEPLYIGGTNDELFAFYDCKMIVQSGWTDELAVSVVARDGEDECEATPNTVSSKWSDWLNFNPTLEITFDGGPVDFGSIEEGTSAVSNTVYVRNSAEAGSGVVMDMYIASDDYFTDPGNPSAICGLGNGIHYTNFSYYATKGSLDSGANDNTCAGLGDNDDPDVYGFPGAIPEDCEANLDEYTPLPSHSGNIDDMCRIINFKRDGSLLTQGSEMSVTFKLRVPVPCEGVFDDGQFHFVGRVV